MTERRRGNEAPAHNRESVVDGGGRQSSPRFGGRREKRRGDRRTPEAKFFGRPQAREKAGRDGRTQAEGEGEIMPPRLSGIPNHRERVSLQSIKNGNWVIEMTLRPAAKGTITSMLRKGWIERRVDPAGVAQFRITQAGKAALTVKIPSSR